MPDFGSYPLNMVRHLFRAAEELGIDISRPERGSDDDDRDRQRVTR